MPRKIEITVFLNPMFIFQQPVDLITKNTTAPNFLQPLTNFNAKTSMHLSEIPQYSKVPF